MAVTLNKKALAFARSMVKHGEDTHDARDDWSKHAPSATQENAFIKKNGYGEYAKWHLGVDKSKPEDTKERYSFPFGDFHEVHRCAVISLESRAVQNDHDSIAKASKKLLEKIDRQHEGRHV